MFDWGSHSVSVLAIVLFWVAVWAAFWTRADKPFYRTRNAVCVLGLWTCLHGWPVLPLLGFDVLGVQVWRGIWGELSIASWCVIAMLWVKILMRWGVMSWRAKSFCWSPWRPFLRSVATLGVVAYPLMLGWGMVDPYVWGYQQPFFILCLCSVLLLALWLDHVVLYAWLAGTLFAWKFQLFESVNLWDYLLDPVAWCIAMGYCIHECRTRVLNKDLLNKDKALHIKEQKE